MCVFAAGPFIQLDAAHISDDLSKMYSHMYKLMKVFSEVAAPRRVADSFCTKINKFKQHLPILSTICNPGIKVCHWEKVNTHTQLDEYCLVKNVSVHCVLYFEIVL